VRLRAQGHRWRRLGRTAKHVAGELIEQDDERQAVGGVCFQVRKLAGRRLLVQREKPLADLAVEGVALYEPALLPFAAFAGRAEPEKQHFGGARLVGHAPDGKLVPPPTTRENP
jgi:hypothetical protein